MYHPKMWRGSDGLGRMVRGVSNLEQGPLY